jgi:CubicO group peptidase (beta-lactamase class C family)
MRLLDVRPSFAALLPVALALSTPAAAQRSPAPTDVDKVFAAFDKPGSPGCALGVAQQGKMLYEKGYGMAELEWAIPNSPGAVFNVGSMSKEFVAASIVLLSERRALSLDDDIRRFIPEMPRYQAPITIRELLHHTSGIRDMLELMVLAGRDINTHYRIEEYLDLLSRQKELNFPPGSAHLYSNSGYLLLGVIVQRASGMSLREFAEKNIFGPLGMKDTHFHDDNRMIIERRAISYAPSGDHWMLDYSTNFDRVGPGGVNTTVRDMALWDHSFDTGALGGPNFRATMLTRGVLTNGDTIPYALALVHGEQGGLPTISHGGSSLGFRAHYVRFPEQHLAVIVQCNTPTNPARLAAQVAELYLGDVMKSGTVTAAGTGAAPATERARGAGASSATTLSAAALAPYAGEYRSEEIGVTYRVAVRDGRLVVQRFGFEEIPVTPTGADRFRGTFGTLEFKRTSSGVPEFRLQGGRMKNLLFKRVGS